MMYLRVFAFVLLFASLSFSQAAALSQNFGSASIDEELNKLIGLVSDILGVLTVLAVLIAAFVYAISQSLSAEYRARATVYANNLLGAALVAAVLFVLSRMLYSSMAATIVFDWQATSLLIALLAVLASGGAIVLFRVFDNRNLEQAAKLELTQAIATVFLVVVLIGLFNFVEPLLKNIAAQMFGMVFLRAAGGNIVGADQVGAVLGVGPGFTLIDVAQAFMIPVQGCITDAMTKLYYAAIPVDALASIYMEIFMSEHATGFAFKLISERISNTSSLLQFFLFAYYLIFHILNFVKVFAPAIFVIGIMLRAFPPTRGGGAYMIALGLGLYFVFPFSYILGNTMYSLLGLEVFSNSKGSAGVDYVQGGVVSSTPVCSFVQGQELPAIFQTCGAGNVSRVGQYLGWFDQFDTSIDALLSILNGTLLKVLYNTVCFLPSVALTLTLTFVLSTTGLFGGNIPEIGRGLVKLI